MDGAFLFGGEPPEELKAAIQKQMDQAEMSEQGFRHDINRLWMELKPEQLATLRTMLSRMSRLENPVPALAYYEGVVTTHLQVVHNVCSGCGVNHDEDILKNLVKEAEVTEPPPPAPEQTVGVNRPEIMAEYGVREPNATDFQAGLIITQGENPVLCIECGTLYQTLEDRTLRPAGVKGCEGCIHKAKWG